MKRSTVGAIFAASLALSQQAQASDAEKAQCRAQLAELNESVRSYNVERDKLKALEAEINELSAALDKEQAAVDRHDGAAIQALNAKIGKNNELVAQHEQMFAAIKAKSAEHKQRAEQLRDACVDQAVTPPASPTLSPDLACSSATGAKDVERRIEATFAEMRADEKQHQDEVDRVAQARAKAQSWSNEKRGKVWLQVLSSPKFMAFEREKRPYVQELMQVIGSKPKNGQEECQLVQRIASMLPAIKAINARQYAFMADEIRNAK